MKVLADAHQATHRAASEILASPALADLSDHDRAEVLAYALARIDRDIDRSRSALRVGYGRLKGHDQGLAALERHNRAEHRTTFVRRWRASRSPVTAAQWEAAVGASDHWTLDGPL